MTNLTEEERQKKAYKKWYELNRTMFNAKRRERYREDPEYRNKALEAVRESRKSRRKDQATKVRTREIGGESVQVYTITEVAAAVGKSPDWIRTWERRGVIPSHVFSGQIRLYTEEQVKLLSWAVSTLNEAKPKDRDAVRKDVAAYLLENWGGV